MPKEISIASYSITYFPDWAQQKEFDTYRTASRDIQNCLCRADHPFLTSHIYLCTQTECSFQCILLKKKIKINKIKGTTEKHRPHALEEIKATLYVYVHCKHFRLIKDDQG